MPTYCYRCRGCGSQAQSTVHIDTPTRYGACDSCGGQFIRDYRAEAVGANLHELRKTSHPDYSDSLFLPSAKDFEKPGDPTGEKGMAKWMDDFRPTADNKNPRWPSRSARQGV